MEIVDACAAPGRTYVPNNLVGDIRPKPKALQPRGDRPAKIMHAPIVGLGRPSIEHAFAH